MALVALLPKEKSCPTSQTPTWGTAGMCMGSTGPFMPPHAARELASMAAALMRSAVKDSCTVSHGKV